MIFIDTPYFTSKETRKPFKVHGISYIINFKKCILSKIVNSSTDKKGIKVKSYRIAKSVSLFDLGSKDMDYIKQYKQKQLLNL